MIIIITTTVFRAVSYRRYTSGDTHVFTESRCCMNKRSVQGKHCHVNNDNANPITNYRVTFRFHTLFSIIFPVLFTAGKVNFFSSFFFFHCRTSPIPFFRGYYVFCLSLSLSVYKSFFFTLLRRRDLALSPSYFSYYRETGFCARG